MKPSQEMQFLYGNHVLKSGLGRITENTPAYAGVVSPGPPPAWLPLAPQPCNSLGLQHVFSLQAQGRAGHAPTCFTWQTVPGDVLRIPTLLTTNATSARRCPHCQVIYSMSDVPLGFGVTAKSTAECRTADPGAIVVFHQADAGEYLRAEDEL